jgi:hypothetical protein
VRPAKAQSFDWAFAFHSSYFPEARQAPNLMGFFFWSADAQKESPPQAHPDESLASCQVS